ncbi:MAG: hypothetical protein IPN86_10540 [Saprospiraceae bacterium]|nr:hypothetical protein [Saprospiraceae bacterium]
MINVLPPAVATFTDAPVYTTMTCEEAGLFNAPDINYSNNSACPISGSLSPVVTSNFTSCGGNIQISWTGVDDCNRPLSYNQIIIVSPAPNPVITSAVPDDVTVSCQDLSSFAIPLDCSNGQDKPCGREGIMAPVLNASNVTWREDSDHQLGNKGRMWLHLACRSDNNRVASPKLNFRIYQLQQLRWHVQTYLPTTYTQLFQWRAWVL